MNSLNFDLTVNNPSSNLLAEKLNSNKRFLTNSLQFTEFLNLLCDFMISSLSKNSIVQIVEFDFDHFSNRCEKVVVPVQIFKLLNLNIKVNKSFVIKIKINYSTSLLKSLSVPNLMLKIFTQQKIS